MRAFTPGIGGELVITAAAVVALLLAFGWDSRGEEGGKGKGSKGEEEEEVDEKGEYFSVVRAEKPPKTACEKKIEGPVLEMAARKSSEDLLKLIPGLLVVQHAAEGKGHQFFMRGFDAVHGSDIEVTVGGVPVNDVSNIHGHGYVDLYFIIPETITSITARGGSFLLAQSDFATAGTIAIDLGIEPANGGPRIIVESGFPLRNRLAFIHSLQGPANSFLATEYVVDEGFGENRWSNRLASLGMVTKETSTGKIEFMGGIYSARFGSPPALRYEEIEAGKIDFYDSYTNETAGQSDRVFLSLSDTLRYKTGKIKLIASTSWRRFEIEDNYTGYLTYPNRGDFRRQRHRAITAYAFGVLEHRFATLGEKLILILLGSWRGDWLDQDESRFDPESGAPWLWSRDALAGIHHVGIAAGIRWTPASWMMVEGGTRTDLFLIWFEDRLADGKLYKKTLWAPSPRIALSFPLTTFMTLFAAYGRGLRSPEARSIMAEDFPLRDVPLTEYRGGRPSITVSDSVEAGIDFSWGRRLRLGLTIFGTFISNETTFDHVSNTNILLNSTRRLGSELDVTVSPIPWLLLSGSLTGVDAKFVESGNRVPGAPWLMASLRATASHTVGLEGSLGGIYVAPRPLAHGAWGMSELVLNLTFAYRWRLFRASLEVENLLSSRICEGQYHYASWFDTQTPRSFLPVIHCSAGSPLSLRVGLTLYT